MALRVVIGIPCLLTGGTEAQSLHLAKALQQIGHKVVVLCYFEYDGAVACGFEDAGCELYLMGLSRNMLASQFIIQTRKALKALRPDVLHVQYMAPGALPIIAARLAGIKTVFATVHQPFTKDHGMKAKMLLRLSALLSTHFVAVSLAAEKSWFGSAAVLDKSKPETLARKHFTIYNCIDTQKILRIIRTNDPVSMRRQNGIPVEAFLFGSVARLRHEKGIDLLIGALGKLVKTWPNVYLLLVGDGPDREVLEQQAHMLKLDGRVIFVGAKSFEGAMPYMQLMDVVVVPSRFEGFGLTAAEALACGKPVIASRTGGLPEVVQEGASGLLFDAGSETSLALKMEEVLQDRAKFERQSLTEYANDNFSTEIFGNQIGLLYSKTAVNS